MPRKNQPALRPLATGLSAVACASVPLVLTTLWLWTCFDATYADYVPTLSDSKDYWHEILSFSQAPFRGGFYGYQQLTPPIGNYGAHGPWIVALMAGLSSLLGWNFPDLWAYNAAFLFVGMAAYALLARPTLAEVLLLAALATVFGPFQQGVAWLMPDMLNLAVAMVMAGIVVRVLEDQNPWPALWALALAVFLAMLIRKTWVLMAPVCLLLPLDRHMRPGPQYVAAVAALTLTASLLFSLTAAPYPYKETLYSGFAYKTALSGNFRPLLDSLAYSLTSLFRLYRENFYFNLFGLHILLAAGLLGFCSAKGQRKYSGLSLALLTPASILLYAFGHLFNGVVAFRHVTPFFLIALLVLGLRRCRGVFLLVLLLNLLFYPAFLQMFRQFNQHAYSTDGSRSLARVQAEFREVLVPAGNGNRWCDTVSIDAYPDELLAFPPGIAFNLYNGEYPLPGGSLLPAYAFTRDIEKFRKAGGSYTPILETPGGTLYRRQAQECPVP